jgi:hypothetical protein
MPGQRILDRTTAGDGEIHCAGRPAVYQITVLNTGTDGMTYGGLVRLFGSNDGIGWFQVDSVIVQATTGFITTGFINDIGAWDRVRLQIGGMDDNARIIGTMSLAPQ